MLVKSFLILCIAVLIVFLFVSDVLSVDRTHLVAYWSFDKGTGQTVPDDSGNSHDGKIIDAEWFEEGKSNSAMSFDGKGAFVEVASVPDLNPGEDDWTIELWIQRSDNAGGWQKILTKYEGNWTGYRIGLLDSTVHVIFGAGPAPNSVEFQTTAKIEDMEWHHLAFVADKDGDAIIYIDGVPDETTMSLQKIGAVQAAQNVEIGRCWWCDGGSTMGFNGICDEIRIWRAALTEDEMPLAMDGKLVDAAVIPLNALPTTWGMLKKATNLH